MRTILRILSMLLDPFFGRTRHAFPPHNGTTTSVRAADSLATLARGRPGMRLHTYVLSIIGEGWLGSDASAALKAHTSWEKVPLPDVCWVDVAQRHCMAHHFYMCSILDEDGDAAVAAGEEVVAAATDIELELTGA